MCKACPDRHHICQVLRLRLLVAASTNHVNEDLFVEYLVWQGVTY